VFCKDMQGFALLMCIINVFCEGIFRFLMDNATDICAI